MNFIKNVMSHFKMNTRDNPAVDLLSFESLGETPASNIANDKMFETKEDKLATNVVDLTKVNSINSSNVAEEKSETSVVDLTGMDSILTSDESQSNNDIVQELTSEIPIINLDEFYDFINNMSDGSGIAPDDENINPQAKEIAKTNKELKKDEMITLDDVIDVIESVNQEREEERPNESQTANTDSICYLNAKSSCAMHENDEKTQTTDNENLNVLLNDVNDDEFSLKQEPLNGFQIEDFEEQIQLFKIIQRDYDNLTNQLSKKEEPMECVDEIENKCENGLNVICQLTSNLDTTEDKANILAVENEKHKIKHVKPVDLNNIELEFSLHDEIPLSKYKNETCSTHEDSDSDSCDGYHSSDFEFISESEAEAGGMYMRCVIDIKSSNNMLQTYPEHSKSAPSISSYKKPTDKMKDQRYGSLNVRFGAEEEKMESEYYEMPHGQNDIDLRGTPSTSKDGAGPSTNNNTQERDLGGMPSTSKDSVVLSTTSNIQKRDLGGIPSTSKDSGVPSTSNNTQRDYRSLRAKFLSGEEERMRKSHQIPQGQDYHDLFGGPNAPIANDLFILENKSVKSRVWCMDAYYEGVGFDVRNMPQQEVSEEDRNAAGETSKKIQEMYPYQNRSRRCRF